MKNIKDLITRNRSYRRFVENERIPAERLRELVELARLSGTGANMQPLKFVLSADAEMNARIFPTLAWAGYLKEWDGPAEGERPAAYIIILGDKRIRNGFGCDHGIAAQSMLLGAVEMGYGGCMIGSIRREELAAILSLNKESFEILLVLALGKPIEKVVLEDVGPEGDIKYYRTGQCPSCSEKKDGRTDSPFAPLLKERGERGERWIFFRIRGSNSIRQRKLVQNHRNRANLNDRWRTKTV